MNARVRVERVSRIFVLASMTFVLLLLGIAASASAGTLDQQQTTSSSNLGLFSTQSDAQTFTAGITGDLDEADLSLSKAGAPPATITVEVRTTSAGKPTATVLASGTVATSALGRSGAFVPVPTGVKSLSTTSRSRPSWCPLRRRRHRPRRPRTHRRARRSPGSAPRHSSGAESGHRSATGRSSASKAARRRRGSFGSSRDRSFSSKRRRR
jgi:hypothetical protein